MRFTRDSQALCLFVVCAASAVIAGCAPSRPALHESFGYSVISAQQAQTANPRADGNVSPVAQMNGLAAKQAMDSYAKTFEPGTEHKTNTANMFLGLTGVGGGE